MKIQTYILAPLLMFAIVAVPAEAAKKKKDGAVNVNGDFAATIVSVAKGEGADAPTVLTVKVASGQKKTPPTDRKFELAKGVKLELVTNSKKAFSIATATIENLKQGQRILIQTKEGSDVADRILVFSEGKKATAVAAE